MKKDAANSPFPLSVPPSFYHPSVADSPCAHFRFVLCRR